ncbi:hypothetical protein LTR04_006856 [Oleoguttula sp. CCFEE 6159]|nr:hypothetical protein LTR04_006856 [Oleoguttula sp. CCFEE 6159]
MDMDTDMEPQLPPGQISALSTLSQSMSFHSSPESFISSRAQNLSSSSTHRPLDGKTSSTLPSIVRARILNRNVAVVSSHQFCKDVLEAESGRRQDSFRLASGESVGPTTFTVNAAYSQLMSDFFPSPNILLLDKPVHDGQRTLWNEQLSSLPADVSGTIQSLSRDHFSSWAAGGTFDLYDSMKDLSWQILLSIFLQLCPTDEKYSTFETLHETLLRGQFSLFPIAVNTRFWRSPRSKGIDARKQLQELLSRHVQSMDSACPFLRKDIVPLDNVASNVLLFTSSIAVKALASLLTATLSNLFLFPSHPSLADQVRDESLANGPILLNSILRETERLSPPVVGVMRRVHQDVIFQSPPGQAPILIPAGWDVWMYFVGAARDSAVYEMGEKFVPERFVSEGAQEGFAFGAGPKTCLGRDTVREIVKGVANAALVLDIRLEGEVKGEGVQGWLGWKTGVSPEAFARDLKQLPCQRPRESIQVRVNRGS